MVRGIVRLIAKLIFALGKIMPWVWKVFVQMVKLVILAQVNYWRNIPHTTFKIANEWVARAGLAGFPSEYDNHLYWIARIVAILVLTAGWILNAFVTVWLIGLIF
jgi:hypothetical protein